MPTIPITD
jgi:hypothetical protein